MAKYVVGLPFSKDSIDIILIEKNHPEWQIGKWNGPGGHIEPGETPLQTIVRECAEETNILSKEGDWKHILTLFNIEKNWEVIFFRAFLDIDSFKSLTNERVLMTNVRSLWHKPIISNLRWIIPLALDETGVAFPLQIEDIGEN